MTDEEIKRLDELQRLLETSSAEVRRHFDITAEKLKHEVQLVAEAVLRVDQKLDQKAGELSDRMDRGFAETQAMIKFSHAELDRRVRSLEQSHHTLEETVTDLQARVERLESSTH